MTERAIQIRGAQLETAADNALNSGKIDVALDRLDEAEEHYLAHECKEDARRVRGRIEAVELTQERRED